MGFKGDENDKDGPRDGVVSWLMVSEGVVACVVVFMMGGSDCNSTSPLAASGHLVAIFRLISNTKNFETQGVHMMVHFTN